MIVTDPDNIIRDFHSFIGESPYPCVAARSAVARKHVPCLVVGHMACPEDDWRILRFLYDFIDGFRKETTTLHSAVIIFEGPKETTEELFDSLLWQRLQSLSDLDAKRFSYDKRVSADPLSPDFSFSLGEEAFFVIGLHPSSSRRSRKFKYPVIVFNPHVQFEELRRSKAYEKMKTIVRRRDKLYSGSVNPMLQDFNEAPESYQYSGRTYDSKWKCPLKIAHEKPEDNSPAK